MKIKAALVTLLVTLGLVAIPASAHANPVGLHRAGWCLTLPVPVAPSAGADVAWKVQATYCQPYRWSLTVDVLTSGSTYTGAYWDWPQRPYSYVDKTLDAGRGALFYDRIGNGGSTRPVDPKQITMASDAHVLHQLISLARLLGARHVNSEGHSYGSGVALAEAATYGDVDALVLTGYLHRPSNPAVTAGNYPANQDPAFDPSLDPGWLTTRPGARATGFHAPDSDPAVVAYDEAHKDLVSLTGLLDFLGQRNTPAATNLSRLVTVPVLVVTGGADAIFCYQPAVWDCADHALVQANEAPYYADVTTVTVPGSGHDLVLHPTAPESFAAINAWLSA